MHPENPYREPASRRYVRQQLEFRNPYFPRETAQEKKKRYRKLTRYSIALVILVMAYGVLFTKIFWIDSVTVEGAAPEHRERIQRLADEKLSQRHGWIIPGRNSLFVSSKIFEQGIRETLEDEISFESLSVTKSKRGLAIRVEERTAQLLWQTEDGRLFLLDRSGIVFSQLTLPEGEPLPDLPLLKNISRTEATIGQEVVTATFAQTVLDAHRQIHQRFPEWSLNGYSPTIRACPPETECNPISLTEISANVAKGTDIYFSTELSLTDQINGLGLVLTQKVPNIDNVDYIDLRFLPRVYYK